MPTTPSDAARPDTGAPAPHRSSTARLWAAIGASAILGIVVVVTLVGLSRVSSVTQEPAAAPVVAEEDALTVAVARTPGGPSEWSNWATIIKYLSDGLERPVSVRYLSKEDEAVEIVADEDIDIAFICAHHYVDLVEAEEVVGVATPVISGSPETTAMLVVRADDEAESFEDLEGSIVSASDKSSLGGYAYLNYLADESGVELTEFFTEVRLGETQEANLREVLDGEARATTVNSAQVVEWDMGEFKIIEESPPFGAPPVVVAAGMPDELRDQVADLLLGLDVDALLQNETAIDGFVPVEEADYEFALVLRDACGHHDHP